jgi:hypothetical protein
VGLLRIFGNRIGIESSNLVDYVVFGFKMTHVLAINLNNRVFGHAKNSNPIFKPIIP